MEKYHETVMQRIRRKQREKEELQRQQERQKRKQERLHAIFIVSVMAILVFLIVLQLPEALDQLWYEQYEKPIEYTNQIQADQQYNKIFGE